jgi:hypothetical protein
MAPYSESDLLCPYLTRSCQAVGTFDMPRDTEYVRL